MLQMISQWCLLLSLLCAVNGEGGPLLYGSNFVITPLLYILWERQSVFIIGMYVYMPIGTCCTRTFCGMATIAIVTIILLLLPQNLTTVL